jgi:hypothetical protein
VEESEARYLDIFRDYVGEARFQEAYRGSRGLCLHHFRLALRHVEQPEQLQTMIAIQRDIWRGLKHDLDEFIRKSDANVTEQRAIAQIAGEKGAIGRGKR